MTRSPTLTSIYRRSTSYKSINKGLSVPPTTRRNWHKNTHSLDSLPIEIFRKQALKPSVAATLGLPRWSQSLASTTSLNLTSWLNASRDHQPCSSTLGSLGTRGSRQRPEQKSALEGDSSSTTPSNNLRECAERKCRRGWQYIEFKDRL